MHTCECVRCVLSCNKGGEDVLLLLRTGLVDDFDHFKKFIVYVCSCVSMYVGLACDKGGEVAFGDTLCVRLKTFTSSILHVCMYVCMCVCMSYLRHRWRRRFGATLCAVDDFDQLNVQCGGLFRRR